MVALHALIKKAQKVGADDLKLARQRLKEVSSWPRKIRT
jgi:phage-related protein